jgi:hypothetical protein
MCLVGAMPLAEHVTMIVRHHRINQLAGVNLLAADDERNVDPIAGHRAESIL